MYNQQLYEVFRNPVSTKPEKVTQLNHYIMENWESKRFEFILDDIVDVDFGDLLKTFKIHDIHFASFVQTENTYPYLYLLCSMNGEAVGFHVYFQDYEESIFCEKAMNRTKSDLSISGLVINDTSDGTPYNEMLNFLETIEIPQFLSEMEEQTKFFYKTTEAQ